MPVFPLLTPRHSAPVPLAELADEFGLELVAAANGPVARVSSVTVNSREVAPGALFAALPGRSVHGAAFVARARAAGAAAVLTDEAGLAAALEARLPVLLSPDPRAHLGRVAARVYATGERRPQLIGVTGTNGKTTTVHVLVALLRAMGVRTGHSSTATRSSGETTVASRLTSPEAPELHALLARMTEDAVAAAAIEVSAQALTRHRVDGIPFDVVGFVNLSHDHLDDFSDMAEYLEAKLRLFDADRSRRGVVLTDSAEGRIVARRSQVPVATLSSDPSDGADWTVQIVAVTPSATSFTLEGPGGVRFDTSVSLIGRHTAKDCALAMVMLLEAGHDAEALRHAVAGGIEVTVPGRNLLVSANTGPRLYLDFSHTPDSIRQTASALREITTGRLIVILGADGDRDPSKRGPMGYEAARGADLVIVTDHHPRFEDPASIRLGLLDGARAAGSAQVFEIDEPARAVRTAIGLAAHEDIVLWVGPGDTDYRVVRGEEVPYSPRRDAVLALSEAGWPV